MTEGLAAMRGLRATGLLCANAIRSTCGEAPLSRGLTLHSCRSTHADLLQVVLELAGTARVPQLTERLGLDLANTLAGHSELATNLLQRAGMPVGEAEA